MEKGVELITMQVWIKWGGGGSGELSDGVQLNCTANLLLGLLLLWWFFGGPLLSMESVEEKQSRERERTVILRL